MRPTLEMPPLPPPWQHDTTLLPRVREIAARLFGGECVYTRNGYASQAGGKCLVSEFGRNTIFDTPEDAAYLAICQTIVERTRDDDSQQPEPWE